eukprot:523179_1
MSAWITQFRNHTMMNDVIGETNTHGHTNSEVELQTVRTNSNGDIINKCSRPKCIIVESGNYKPTYKYTNTYSELKTMKNNYDNFDVDDAGLSKPRRHNYNTLTMKSGIAIANELKKD